MPVAKATLSRHILLGCLALAIPCTALASSLRLEPPQQPLPLTYFGMHFHNIPPRWKPETKWPEVRFGALRVPIKWADMEPQKNRFNFDRVDKIVALAREHHVKVLLPLVSTPTWASSRPEEKGYDNKGAAAQPTNIEDWQTFVHTVATRYRGQIEAYEIWNEPNLKGYWSGDVERLVAMVRDAYRTIKEADPAAIVVLSAPTGPTGPQFLDQFLRAGGGQYGDVVGYHFYVQGKPPEEMAAVGMRVQEVLRANRINKPLWNTEAGFEAPKPFPSDELAAAYVARALTLVWAAGASRFYWYAWDNHDWVVVEMVERDNVTLKSAAKTYAAIESWLLGAVMQSCASDSAGNWVCGLQRGGTRQWIVWNPSGTRTFTVPAEWHVSQRTPLLGSPERIAGTTVEIGQAPILLEK